MPHMPGSIMAVSDTHLAMETRRQRSDLATARTTQVLLGLFSLACWLAAQGGSDEALQPQTTAWYAKREVSFSDVLYHVRVQLWRAYLSCQSCRDTHRAELPPATLDLMATV